MYELGIAICVNIVVRAKCLGTKGQSGEVPALPLHSPPLCPSMSHRFAPKYQLFPKYQLVPKQHLHPDAMLTQSWLSWRNPDSDLEHCWNIAWILRGRLAHYILHNSITSILQQVCVASPIFCPVQQHHVNIAANLRCKFHFHPVQQHHDNTAASLGCKFHFPSCPAGLPQYCSKPVLQVRFSILSSSIKSIL